MSEKQHILLLSVLLVSCLSSGLCTISAQEGRLTGRNIMVKTDERPDGYVQTKDEVNLCLDSSFLQQLIVF